MRGQTFCAAQHFFKRSRHFGDQDHPKKLHWAIKLVFFRNITIIRRLNLSSKIKIQKKSPISKAEKELDEFIIIFIFVSLFNTDYSTFFKTMHDVVLQVLHFLFEEIGPPDGKE